MADGEMRQVSVTIAGRSYRMACGEGEEKHLEALAAMLDGKIADMRSAFGEIGDMRLHVMAALTMADELFEARAKLVVLEAELTEAKRQAVAGGEREQFLDARLTETMQKAAERIEAMAKALNTPAN